MSTAPNLQTGSPINTTQYNVSKLVYFESTNDINAAVTREKQIKGWTRAKKVALIESINHYWQDLSEGWF